MPPSIYAIVESATYSEDEDEVNLSKIFVPLTKEVEESANRLGDNMKFYLADVEAFVSPIAVVPDIGGASNGYFLVKNKGAWKECFERWLRAPHNLDIIDESDEESDGNEHNYQSNSDDSSD